MSDLTNIIQSLNNSAAKASTYTEKLKQVAVGDENTVVDIDGTQVPSLKRAVGDLATTAQVSAAEAQGYAVEARSYRDQASQISGLETVEDAVDVAIPPAIIDGERRAIENQSGGKNTLVIDADGNRNIMVVIPRFNYEDLGLTTLNLGVGTPTAFQTNGAPRSEILAGKYLASTLGAGTAVIGGKQPRVSVNYDIAKQLCTRKGANWHLMSAHEWAAIALWSLANGTVPRGNTNHGRSHEKYWETARRADNGIPGDTAGTASTDTGKGPASWNHTHDEFGIADLVGNVWEWIDQLKLQDGRIITTLDNDPTVIESNWIQHDAYMDATTPTGGNVFLNSTVTNRLGAIGDNANSGNSASVEFRAMTKDPSYTPLELLRRLLIESASATDNVTGRLYMRNFGERLPIRGGGWRNGSDAGLGALNLDNPRASASSSIGFRPALFV